MQSNNPSTLNHPLSTIRHPLSAILIILLLLLTSCQQPRVPKQFSPTNTLPKIYPDYADVTIPVNIAPLCFELLNEADDAVTRFSAANSELLCQGLKTRPDIGEWKKLLKQTQGKDITVEVFAEKDGQWVRYKPFAIHVSPDSIDPWMSYRLISPSYVSYEELTINQRCLENFDEETIIDNMLCSSESGGQCVNCHSFQQRNPRNMQFHARQSHGGTIITYEGTIQKVASLSGSKVTSPQNLEPQTANHKPQTSTKVSQHSTLNTQPLIPVYPSWHPTEKLIAYSCNKTVQSFHTVDLNKIEVYDAQSFLVLYDIDHHKLTTIEDLPDELETFPSWAPDGKSLYYCSAHFKYEADSIDLEELTLRTKELKYDIYRRPFDPVTHEFGERELVYCADSSAALPRISPDGQWLLFTQGEYGTFHIWHRDADLWLMNLTTGQTQPLEACNSPESESYHCWSGNGRWIVFSSRRNDGVFTRPFFAHVDEDGTATKPFELPCQDPDYHLQLLKSYNVPELMLGPVSISPQTFAAKLKEVTSPDRASSRR